MPENGKDPAGADRQGLLRLYWTQSIVSEPSDAKCGLRHLAAVYLEARCSPGIRVTRIGLELLRRRLRQAVDQDR
jgi:hypothetical protein